MYRLVVSYRTEADGSLVSCGPPSGRERATAEGLLYRKLARFVDAEPAAIAAMASRLGPLGPTGPVATLTDERTLIWQLGEGMAAFVSGLDELDAWIDVRGSITIPGRLTAAANLIASMAQQDPELSAGLLTALDDHASLGTEERAHLRGLFWDEGFRVLGRYDSVGNTMARQVAQGEAYVAVPREVTVERLRLTRELLRRSFAAMGRDGGMSAAIEPGGMGQFATLMSQYRSAQDSALSLPQTVSDWRRAAEELAYWTEAVRLLRRLAAGHDESDELEGVLGHLREFAGVGEAEQQRRTTLGADNIDTLRGLAASLLTLRLQQVDAWPLPADDMVGTFARALWSLWNPITGRRAPMRCGWRAGCLRLLPEGAHRNRRYCSEHKREVDRERAAKNRSRRSEALGSSTMDAARRPAWDQATRRRDG